MDTESMYKMWDFIQTKGEVLDAWRQSSWMIINKPNKEQISGGESTKCGSSVFIFVHEDMAFHIYIVHNT